MKIKKYLFKSLAFSGALILLASCATMQTAQRTFPDDVYGQTPEPQAVAQDTNSDANEQYSDQEYAGNYYDDYYDGYNDRFLYGNRLNRFYYSPGMPFYDPWMNSYDYYSPYYYSPFQYSPFRSSFYIGLGFGSPWYDPFNSWYSPYGYPGYGYLGYGYSSLGWGYPYYGSYWGPYSYYGGGYPVNVRNERTRPTRLGTDNVVRPTRPSFGSGSSIIGERTGRPTTNSTARPTRGQGTANDRTPNATTRPAATERPTTTRPTQQTRPTQTRTPVARPSAPTVSRPSTSSASPTSSAPSRSSGSSGNTRSR